MKINLNRKEIIPEEFVNEIKNTVSKCYGCGKCTSGCPVADEMDFTPSIIVKWLILGEYERIIKSKTIWVCSSCQTCVSRCPFEIDIPEIIDKIKEYTCVNNLSSKERATRLFHKIFLANIKYLGRIHEASFIGIWKGVSFNWFSDLFLGVKLFLKGKLKIKPEMLSNQKEIKKFFKSKRKR